MDEVSRKVAGGLRLIAANDQVFAMAGAFVVRLPGTNAEQRTNVQKMINSLINNVLPDMQYNSDKVLMCVSSHPAIANTHVVCS